MAAVAAAVAAVDARLVVAGRSPELTSSEADCVFALVVASTRTELHRSWHEDKTRTFLCVLCAHWQRQIAQVIAQSRICNGVAFDGKSVAVCFLHRDL